MVDGVNPPSHGCRSVSFGNCKKKKKSRLEAVSHMLCFFSPKILQVITTEMKKPPVASTNPAKKATKVGGLKLQHAVKKPVGSL